MAFSWIVRRVLVAPHEQDIDLPTGEPHCVAPGGSTNGAPNTGRGTIGLQVGE